MNAPATIAAPQPAAMTTGATRNIMIVGVGGQGVIMISKVMALLGQNQGLQVKQSEVHGMAKRGGIVFSHVRFGKEVWSPTIARGDADALIALEWAEGLRWLEHLKPGSGVFIADTRRIVLDAGGRLYPAKDGRMGPAMFKAGYPRWNEFLDYVDPRFSSGFWRRVMGGGA